MYVVSRSFKLKKGFYQDMISNFNKGEKPSGVVRREVHLNDIKQDYDVLTFVSYWLDKSTFNEWHKSKHKDNVKGEKPDHILEVNVEKTTLIGVYE